MTNRGKKRALALCLSLALLMGMLPGTALADEGPPACASHPEHTADCGYAAPIEETPCKHEQGTHKVNGGGADREGPLGGDEACGWTAGTPETPCGMGCAELDEAGAVLHAEGCAFAPAVAGTPCDHTEHDGACGFVEAAEGFPCIHTCEMCAVQDSGAGETGPGASGPELTQANGPEPRDDIGGKTWEITSHGDWSSFVQSEISQVHSGDTVRLKFEVGDSGGIQYEEFIPNVDWSGVTVVLELSSGRLTIKSDIGDLTVNNSTTSVSLKADVGTLRIESGKVTLSATTGTTPTIGDVTMTGGTFDPGSGNTFTITGTFDFQRGLISSDNYLNLAPGGKFVNNSGQLVEVRINGGEAITVAPGATVGGTGDFTVTGDPAGCTYDGSTRTLTVKNGAALTISGTTTEDKIKVERGAKADITLNGVNIDVSGTDYACAFDMTGAKVALTLADGSDNVLKSGYNRAGLEAPDGSTLTIDGGGSLTATGGDLGAGIGGGRGSSVNGGTITISGGSVTATGGDGGAGIGGGVDANGKSGSGGTIAITGGTVEATGGGDGAGIGGGYGGIGGTITISGGTVEATGGGNGGAGIGGGYGGSGGTIAIQDSAVVFATSSGGADHIGGGGDSGSVTKEGGVIFEGTAGAAYGDVTLPGDLTVPGGYVLTNDHTLTNNGTLTNDGEIKGSGTLTGDGTFGGSGAYTLKVTRDIAQPTAAAVEKTGVTLNAVIPKGDGTVAYAVNTTNAAPVDGWQNGTEFPGLTENTTYYFFARVTEGDIYQDAVSTGQEITTSAEATYSVTVNGGTGGGVYHLGDTVTITATVPGGKQFSGWTIAPDVTFTEGSESTSTAKFTMPAQAVTATAGFENKPSTSGGGGGGNTPSPTEQAVSKVEKAKDGDTVKLDLTSGGKLPGKVLEAAAGKDITLEIDAGGGVTWIINGKDIPKGKLSDLNLRVDANANTIPVTVLNALTGEQKVMQLALSHNGPFDFPLTLRLETGKEHAGLFANLYYYNETSKALEYQTTAKIGTDGTAYIPFAHASSYAVVIDQASHAPVTWENPFTDVNESDWFYEAVAYVHGAGLMTGTGETAFSPGGAVTRAQVWTVLARLDGQDTTGGAPWYASAQAWAVITGVSDGANPDGAVSREQLVTMLYRYAQNAGMDVSAGGDTNILSYDDALDVAEWAVPAFQWACGAGIVSGTSDTTLSPQAGATRAQLAAILTRLLKIDI